jgi:hypothetical protein
MGGPCDAAVEGETMEEVAQKGSTHVVEMGASDEAHKKVHEDMEAQGEEGKTKWFSWFKSEWDKK